MPFGGHYKTSHITNDRLNISPSQRYSFPKRKFKMGINALEVVLSKSPAFIHLLLVTVGRLNLNDQFTQTVLPFNWVYTIRSQTCSTCIVTLQCCILQSEIFVMVVEDFQSLKNFDKSNICQHGH